MAEAVSQAVLARARQLQQQAALQEQETQRAAMEAAALEAERNRSRGAGEVLSDAGLQLVQGAVGLGQAAFGVGNLVTGGVLDHATQFSQRFQQTNEYLNSLKSAPTQARLQDAQQAFDEQGVLAGLGEYATSPALLQDLVLGNAASLIPAGAAGRAAAGAAAEYATARGLGQAAAQQLVADRAEQAVLRTVAAQTAGSTNVEAINQIRDAGGSEEQQRLGGVGAALLAGTAAPLLGRLTGAARFEALAANALPGGTALGATAAGAVRGAVGGVARESTEESLQSASEQLAQNVVTPGQNLWDGVGQQAAIGGLAGGLLGGGLGAYAGLSSPRSETALRQDIRTQVQQMNAELGQPLGGSPLVDPLVPGALTALDSGPLDLEPIDLAATPLPGERPLAEQLPTVEEITFEDVPLPNLPQVRSREIVPEEIQGAPAPLRTLYDITGRRPSIRQPLPGLPEVEELPAPPRTGLLGVLDAQRGRGQLGGTDLFAGPLTPEGAFPTAAPAPASTAAPTVAENQGSLDFDAPLPNWKQSLARELGLKPANFRGKAWEQFVQAAEQAGVTPQSAAAGDFLRQIAPQLTSDPASAPVFAARLAERYPSQDGLNNELDAVTPTQGATPGDRGDPVLEEIPDFQPAEVQDDTLLPAPGASQRQADRAGIAGAIQDTKIEIGRLSALASQLRNNRPTPAALVEANRAELAKIEQMDVLSRLQGETPPPGREKRKQRLREQIAVGEQAETQRAAEAVATSAAIMEPTSAVPGDVPPPVPVGVEARISKQAILDPTASREQNITNAFMDMMADSTSADLLDETFIAIKHHPAWAELSDDQQTELAEEFELRYARVEGGDPGKFNRTPGGVANPMPTQAFAEFVASANRLRGPSDPEVIPVEDAAQYELLTGQAAPDDAAGIFADGKVYLVRSNLASTKDAALTLAHERGHHGLDKLLGDRLPAVMNRLWTNAATRDAIKAKMIALKTNDAPLNTKDGGLRRLAAEEVLADMLASGRMVNGDILSKARSAVDSFFATALGYSDLKLSNAEVDKLLRDVGIVLRGSPKAVFDRRERPVSQLKGLVDLMGDPNSGMADDARYSRALTDLDEIAAAALAEGEGTRRDLNQVTRQFGQASLDKLKGVGNAVTDGGVFATLLDATPLNQMVNLYGQQFDGRLNTFARLKRGKESDFNKNLTQPRELTYPETSLKSTTSPLQVARDWDAFQRANPAKAEALNRLQQYSTLYRVWPDRKGGLENQSQLKYAEQSFTEDERAQALKDLQRLWASVGAEGQQIYRDSQAVYANLWTQRFQALSDQVQRTTGRDPESEEFKKAFTQRMDSALQRLKTGPYSPLQRYGDYFVTVRAADGSIAWFSGHDTKAEADKAAAEYRRTDFADPSFKVNTTARTEFDWRLDGLSPNNIRSIEGAVDALPALAGDDKAAIRAQLRDAMVEAYLQSLPQQSFLQHANLRKGVGGFTLDAFRGFNDYSIKAARSISGLRYDDRITGALGELQSWVTNKARGKMLNAQGELVDDPTGAITDTTKLQRVVDAVKRQHAASLKFERSPVADLLSQGGFLWFMTSPSQLFINAMQTPMVSLPRLAGTYGNGTALRSIKNALGVYTKSSFDMLGPKSALAPESIERQVLDRLYQRGVLDFTLAHDMSGAANGDGDALSGHWKTMMEWASKAMHKSEVFNRQVTALAATRLEMDKAKLSSLSQDPSERERQLERLADTAEDAVLTTQFDYSQSNKPTLLQGPWRKLIFQFQQYRLNMLAMMAKDIRDASFGTAEEKATARRTLAWMLGAQLAVAGAAGSVLAPFVFFIADMFRDDDDLLDSRTEFSRAVPQWMAHGLLAGALDTGRLGADSLIPILGDRAYAPKDADAKESFEYYLMRNLGPWVGLLGGAAGGVDKLFNGDLKGAAKGIMPKPFADAYSAVYESQMGARDSRQIVYYEPGVWSTATALVGLRSGERREAEGLRGAGWEAANHANVVKQRYLGRLAMGHALSDQELVDEAMAGIQSWNNSNPDLAIRASDIRRAIINRVRAQQNADLYGLPTARAPSQSLKEALAL